MADWCAWHPADMPAPAGRGRNQTCPARPGNCTWCTTRTAAWPTAAGPVPPAGRLAGLALLVLFVRQRQRLARLRQRSRQELETVLQQHAQNCAPHKTASCRPRSKPAQQTDTGLSRSLEHLPQGVVIIDADLNLVAWNSRYVELFRYPADLMQVGRPIADLLRHNAAGLAGPGPVEKPSTPPGPPAQRQPPPARKRQRATARC